MIGLCFAPDGGQTKRIRARRMATPRRRLLDAMTFSAVFLAALIT